MAKRALYALIGTAFLLLVPLIAMQFTDEVKWSLADFLVAGGLLFGMGVALQWAWSGSKTNATKILICAEVLVVFVLLWAHLAVGLF